MNINYFRSIKSIFFLLSILFALGSTFVASAQNLTSIPFPSTPNEVVPVATVNIQDAKLIKQERNIFTIGFTISNREGIQPKIIYAVVLKKINKTGEASIVDQKNYDAYALTLGVNESVHKEITYVAPSYLKGSFTLGLEARNSDGLAFGFTTLEKDIVLYGKEESLLINPNDCYLTVVGEKSGKKYTLTQGVDIKNTETLTAHCSISSSYKISQIITPIFETRYRSTFGKIINTENISPLTILPNKKIDFIVNIPKTQNPQAYDAILIFLNSSHGQVSPPVDFHYVLRGDSATIQNLTADKNVYRKGDTANISFFWSGGADTFPGARYPISSVLTDIDYVLSLIDGKNNACTETQKLPLEAKNRGGVVTHSLTITKDCVNPIVIAKIVDQSGKVLAENSYDLTSNSLPNNQTNKKTKQNQNPISLFFITFLILLALILLLIIIVHFVRKNKQTGIMIMFGFISTLALLSGSHEAHADTFTSTTNDPHIANHYIVTTYVVGINKSIYKQGEPIKANAIVTFSACQNGVVVTDNIDAGFNAYAQINGAVKSVLNRTAQFVAPEILGKYNAYFGGWTTWADWIPSSGSINIPYTVIARTTQPDVTLTLYDSSIAVDTTTLLIWTPSGSVTSCVASGEWLGNKSISGGSQTVGPFSSTGTHTYNIQCTGPSGSSQVISQTLQVTDAPPTAGTCGTANGTLSRKEPNVTTLCATGDPSDVVRNTNKKSWEWKCFGTYGGASSVCTTKPETTVNFKEF